ncbi:RNA polymerase sigma factor [Pedobacter deserti]|uniref:RNA polymerase sigma factor n=1 Tax=Pedobacter deserti TaxID=2817382 RepID=UPI00210B533F|nr:RNA polymerase sigma-70 factor [Pedobacter sp. SYSU D00382]
MEVFRMQAMVPDETLISRLKSNDAHALEVLFNRYYKSLCQFCGVYTKDYEAAEEIVADLFIRIWDNRHNLDVDHAKAYLFASARNMSLNFVQKKKQPVQSIEDIPDSDQRFRNTDTPLKIISGRESSAQILQLIDQLPPRQREILLMSRIDQVDKHEIAHMLNISLRTVETTLYQSVKELRSLLKRASNLNLGG